MFAIYIYSDHSTLHGYWTGKTKKDTKVINGSTYRELKGLANIPVLANFSLSKSAITYKTEVNAIKVANSLQHKLREPVLDDKVNKYWNSWNIEVINLSNNRVAHRITSQNL